MWRRIGKMGILKMRWFTTYQSHEKCFLNWNKDTVQDEVIFNHLLELSDNKLKVREEDLPLTDASEFLKIRSKMQWFQKQPKTEEQKKQQSQKILIRSFNG